MRTDTKQLNIEALRKLIDQVTSSHPNPDDKGFNVVTEKLRTMNELLYDLSTLTDEGDLEETRRRISISQRESKEAMEEFLKQYGTSIEETEAYFRDPNNFSQQEWEHFQHVRKEVEEAIETPQAPTPMRLVRRNKK